MPSEDDLQLHEYLEQDNITQNGKLDPFSDGYEQLPSPRSSVTGKQSRHSAFEDEQFTSALSDLYVRDRTRSSLSAVETGKGPTPGNARLVIAIDYGTTYTGLAWSTTSSTNAELKLINILQNWTTEMSNQDKVRSMYSYARPGEAQWGSDIKDDAIAMVNTKLELGPRETRLDELEATLHLLRGTKNLSFAHIRAAGPEPAFSTNSPTKIITDYLTRIRECACNESNINIGKLVTTKTPVDLVITVPVNWSYQAKNATFQAFRNAGFNKATFPTLEDTILVSEPEAASYFTARDLQDSGVEFLEVDQCYVLCDAGGGTVDVVSYQVKRSDSLVELEKATTPESGRCGSVFIDLAFKHWLRKVIGSENYNKLDPANAQKRIYPFAAESGSMRELLRRFEVKKKAFSRTSRDVKLDLPAPLNKLHIEGRVREGELTISYDEMEEIFAESVDGVIYLIEHQIDEIKYKKNRRVKSVFLQQLQDSLDLRTVKMQRPDASKSWTATVRGAAIYGIEKSRHRDVEYMSAMTRSYAILTSADKRFEWLIRKGDLVLRNEKRSVQSRLFWMPPEPDNKFDLPIYVYRSKDDDNVPNEWLDGQHEVKAILHVRCNAAGAPASRSRQTPALPYPQDSVRHRSKLGPLVCRMQLSGTRLEVTVLMNEVVLGRAEMKFEVDQPRTHSVYPEETWQDFDE